MQKWIAAVLCIAVVATVGCKAGALLSQNNGGGITTFANPDGVT